MHYIYLEPELKVINITDYPSSIFGELIGTTDKWKESKPAVKKMLLNAFVSNSNYKGIIGLKIVDCEDLGPADPLENSNE